MKLRLLAIGDVTGSAGVEYLKKNLRRRIDEWEVDLTVVNGENAADVHGISERDVHDIFAAGADVITTGNHAFGRRDVYQLYEDMPRLLRPDNFPPAAPGCGSVIVSAAGARVLCMNIQGNVAMNEALSSPFAAADAILAREAGKYDAAVLDLHAEATSEKIAMGIYLDGRVSAVWGTHTHVATADERILPGGTAYVTDHTVLGNGLHVVAGYVARGEHAEELAVVIDYRHDAGLHVAHGAPGQVQRYGAVERGGAVIVHVLHLCAHVFDERRGLHAEAREKARRLVGYGAYAHRLVRAVAHGVLEAGVGQRGHDGICIRVAMPGDENITHGLKVLREMGFKLYSPRLD